MPVVEHEVHTHGVRDDAHRYGCFNRKPFREWCESSSLMDASHWPFRMSRECRYDRSETDPACKGCKHIGSGAEYIRTQEQGGAK